MSTHHLMRFMHVTEDFDFAILEVIQVGQFYRVIRQWAEVPGEPQATFCPAVYMDIPMGSLPVATSINDPFEFCGQLPEGVGWSVANVVQEDLCFLRTEIPSLHGENSPDGATGSD